MYSDQVFCFTPKGDVVKLPRGATPIDFAFAIHTRIGSAIVGAKVDGLRVPLWTRLKTGSRSRRLRRKDRRLRPAGWRLPRPAKRKRRSADPCVRCTANGSSSWDRNWSVRPLSMLTQSHRQSVGYGCKTPAAGQSRCLVGASCSAEITAHDVVQAVYPDLAPDEGDQISPRRAVIGLQAGQSFERAPCCQPLPGRTDRGYHLSRKRRGRARYRLRPAGRI